ncbi:lipoprotein [Streptomyces antimicrobicus]|uniref:Lipoprotein n=1 Tax=Streptomyces antimicrobicus TaxID=2883108 RepID=A0ABS8B1P7_9ACTN|nr:lipoprotein [Streptomyces antimicrobicus]MCB5178526.1 lipoprotein [Streptomyces antimicrobicus]
MRWRSGVRGLGVVLAVGVLGTVGSGCSGAKGADPGASQASSSTASGPASAGPGGSAAPDGSAAPAGGTVGAQGSACPLPVGFSVARGWKAKGVDARFEQGGLVLGCEVDAKPAGHVGFLRVWVADRAPGDARVVLQNFLATVKATGTPSVTDTTAGALPAVEALYEATGVDGPKQERALAVLTPSGAAVVLHLGGLDTAEHRAMLPAYQLARQSLTAAP